MAQPASLASACDVARTRLTNQLPMEYTAVSGLTSGAYTSAVEASPTTARGCAIEMAGSIRKSAS
ncbi:hypothetical protein D9M68_734250 [compost metagenome]